MYGLAVIEVMTMSGNLSNIDEKMKACKIKKKLVSCRKTTKPREKICSRKVVFLFKMSFLSISK